MNLTQLLPAFSEIKTPFYFYDESLLQQTLNIIRREIAGKPYHVHYALKANVNERLLRTIAASGLGADCVSGNEVRRALEVGFRPEDIVFAGVGKTDQEMAYALEKGIFSFNVESVEELEVLNGLAKKQDCKAKFALRINPQVDAGTHEYITTGNRDNKFGITMDELWLLLDRLADFDHLSFIGIHFHIGSQIADLNRFRHLALRINELQRTLVQKGFELPHINVGGGLGIDYDEPDAHSIAPFKAFFETFEKHLELLPGQQLHFELGRSVVGPCGSLISRVLYTKPGEGTTFLVLDAGMTELIRPALYRAAHFIQNLSSRSEDEVYDVVGPICESSDVFARCVRLPHSGRGDLIAIRSAGAYGQVMASRYNLRDLPQAVYSGDLKV